MHMTTTGGRAVRPRPAQVAVEPGPLVRDGDALAGRIEQRQRQIAAFDRLAMGAPHLLVVGDEDELGEVIADGGAVRCSPALNRKPAASASRPRRSWTRGAGAPCARTSRSQRSTPAVTSWKSVSGTPFATKRGAQCWIADWTLASGIAGLTAGEVGKRFGKPADGSKNRWRQSGKYEGGIGRRQYGVKSISSGGTILRGGRDRSSKS